MKLTHLIIASVTLVGSTATADTKCGSSPASVNIPGGAIALQASAGGPISTVLKAAGETRTHSMIAHGNGYITHATMYTPSQASGFSCSAPIDANGLQYGAPGMEQINMGALYAFTYGSSGPASGQIGTSSGTVEFFYQNGNGDGANRGQAIANWLWTVPPYWDAGNGTWKVGFPGNNAHANYSLYQYKDMETIASGGIPSWNGSVCSTTLAWAQDMSGNGVVNNNNTYSHTVVANALGALHDNVYNSCSNGLGFWTSVLADTVGAIACTRWSSSCTTILGVTVCAPEAPSVCTLAADQVSNCFATGQCGSSNQKTWQGVQSNSGATATSISPDNIGGWANHGWGTTAPHSVWSYDNQNAVYWNSPGNVYGCW